MGSYDYAGCLSLPRMLYLCGNRLIQVRRLPPQFTCTWPQCRQGGHGVLDHSIPGAVPQHGLGV